MMHELAEALRGCDIPVWVKNPVCPDVELWIGAVERLQQAGLKDVRIIHRGFCTVDSSPYRNAPLWELAERFHTHFPKLPFYCDPSHIVENVNYWLLFAGKLYLCMRTDSSSSLIVVRRKLCPMQPSS